jgi:xanthine dehydrogenase YagS FAD-binding subunit
MSAPFLYEAAKSEADALKALSATAGASYLAGGTTLIDLWKLGAMQPSKVVDINALPLAQINVSAASGAKLGALVRMSDAAANAELTKNYPVVVESLLLAASAQIRNMASLGGNLLQRPRSFTYRNPNPNAGDAPGRTDAIFGVSAKSAAPHPSDFAVALMALEASVKLRRATGERTLNVGDFYRVPGDEPLRLTNLLPGELIVGIEIPAAPFTRRSAYVKIRDRSSYQFALVSVAAALDIQDDVIRDARIAAGGVGTKPWRLKNVESALRGQPADEASYLAAAAVAAEGATTNEFNAFKIPMLQRTIVRACLQAEAIT